VRRAALVATVILCVSGSALAQPPPLVHGGDAIFSGAGVRVVWSVLRSSDEASTLVVITVSAGEPSMGAVAAEGVDPFSGARVARAAPVAIAGRAVLRVPRGAFADHPRTELRLAADVDDLRAGRAARIVYFTGVPDATPEFTDERARAAWVDSVLDGRR
jgi:hypothetical protein